MKYLWGIILFILLLFATAAQAAYTPNSPLAFGAAIQSFSVTTTSANQAVPANSSTLELWNTGANLVCVALGTNTVTASCSSTSSIFLLPYTFTQVLTQGATYIAYIASGANSTLAIIGGNGTAFSGFAPVINSDGGILTHITNFPATQPISASSLPLPTNAATAPNQTNVQGSIGAGTAPADMVVGGGVYNSSAPSLTTGQSVAFQTDVNGNLKVNVVTATGISNSTSATGLTGSGIMAEVTTSAQSLIAGNLNWLTIDANGYLKTDCVVGCTGGGGTSAADEATFTAGTTNYTPVGGTYNTGTISLTSGQGGALRLTTDRNLMTDLNEVAGTALGAPSNYGTSPGAVSVLGVNAFVTNTVTANPGTPANWAVGATGSAVPANAHYSGAVSSGNLVGIIQADNSAAINVSTATTTQLVALSSGKKIYVTSFDVVAGGTGNITFEYGTGTACGTGTTPLTGAYPLTAQSGLAQGIGLGPVLIVPAGNALCVLTSAAVQMSGSISYTQF